MTLKNKVSIIVYNAMLSVASLVLVFLGNLAIFPIFPFLRADFSDAPIFLAALISGVPSGISVFIIVSIIRAMLFSSTGLIGLIMRSTSIIMILALGVFREKKFPVFYRLILISLGILSCVAVKIILNQFFWINFFSISEGLINSLLYVIILPYNVIKVVINTALAITAHKYLEKCLKNKVINI